MSQRKWRCLKGAVLNIKFGPFYVFSSVFFTPPRYDYPLDATLVLWQYESRIRGGLLYIYVQDNCVFLNYPVAAIVYEIVFPRSVAVETCPRPACWKACCLQATPGKKCEELSRRWPSERQRRPNLSWIPAQGSPERKTSAPC